MISSLVQSEISILRLVAEVHVLHIVYTLNAYKKPVEECEEL